FKKTIPDKVEKFQNQLAVASIMIDMFRYIIFKNIPFSTILFHITNTRIF
ncbi:hypothetical protein N3930_36270, partial [Bacillus thuringiensis]|nr:hypothetical protein [Bacillus thuringiensis]